MGHELDTKYSGVLKGLQSVNNGEEGLNTWVNNMEVPADKAGAIAQRRQYIAPVLGPARQARATRRRHQRPRQARRAGATVPISPAVAAGPCWARPSARRSPGMGAEHEHAQRRRLVHGRFRRSARDPFDGGADGLHAAGDPASGAVRGQRGRRYRNWVRSPHRRR